jgi:hypothetical protein
MEDELPDGEIKQTFVAEIRGEGGDRDLLLEAIKDRGASQVA